MRTFVVNMADERTRWAITADALAQLQSMLPEDWRLLNINAPVSSVGDGSGSSEEALAAVADAEVYAGFGFPRALYRAATANGAKLRWIHTGAAGVGALLYPELVSADVVITNSAGIHARPMAETVIAMALHFARGFDFAVRSQTLAKWDQSAFESVRSRVVELDGLTMGILGFGGVGREVARRARALGMRVIAARRNADRTSPDAEIVAGNAPGIERVLRVADVVVIAMPSTSETRGLIGARELGLLKPNAVLINVARGNIIDEAALIDVLKAGAIRGAALDVFAHEPLAENSPLWALPNTLILPHISATTPRYWEREAALITENFGRYLRHEPLLNTVDKTAGY